APSTRPGHRARQASGAERRATASSTVRDAGRLHSAQAVERELVKIGVNARRLEGEALGVARYIEYILQHWTAMLDRDERVGLFVREPLEPGRLPPQSAAFEQRVVRPKLRGFMWETLRLGPAARNVDVLFGPSYSLPLGYRGPTVVTIHSINEVQEGTHPWWYP